MRFHHSDDETGATFSDRDERIARALADAAGSTVELAETLGIGLGECERCGDRAPLRGYDVLMDGEFTVVDVCKGCQGEWVRDAKEQEAMREAADE